MTITIFTPTYNRADKLKRLYESLKNQTNKNFDWLIVDDGSKDDTKSVVDEFISENIIKINYVYQRNGGKHRAYNKALELAEGDLFFTVDSDDWMKDDSVENILNACKNLKSDEWLFAYKLDEKGTQLSDNFPESVDVTSADELSNKYNCSGEFSIIFPTALAKKYPFPTFEEENFITESVIYDRIDKDAKLKLLPQAVTVCEYQEDGLSNNLNRIMKNNPAGYCLYFMQRIDMQKSLKGRLITAGKYNCFKMFAKKKACKYDGKYRTDVILSKPLGTLFWLYYKIVRHF